MLPGRGGKPQFVRFGFKGCPDAFALLVDGRTLWIETKAPGGKLSQEQLAFQETCRMRGVPHVVARRWEDIEVWLRGAP